MTPPPDLPRALQQAALLQRQSRFREAEGLYREILRSVPDNFDALHGLALIRLQVGDYPASIRLFHRALAIDPRSTAAYNNLGGAFQAINRHEDAIQPYRRALAIDPDFADAHNNLGAALKSLGRLEEARQAFERAVALAPGRPAFYRNLVDSRRVTVQDPWWPALERLADHLGTMPQESRIQLHFALAKAYADFGQNERSFNHQLEGNALKRRQIVYDEGNTLGLLARTRAVFDQSLMTRHRGQGDPSSLPVFIVGMPRSGTSLVEQILASHPLVFGAGELREFEMAAAGLRADNAGDIGFPEIAARVPSVQFSELGARYVKRLAATAPAAQRITDKMPINFRFVGLINLALPNARIIHTRRDPVDTCLSCFSILFMGNQPHTYNLGELGRYYRVYEALMAHWRAVLPEGAMIEVAYDALVTDLESEARRMVTHCGLDWDPACLDFHKTERPVRTASALQVRQPIYRDALTRWRPPKALLHPLIEALAPG